MEARVETRDLRHTGKPLGYRIDCREVVRLVQRRQWYQRPQVLHDLGRDDRRSGVPRAAMDYAMPNAQHSRTLEAGAEPGSEELKRGIRITDSGVERSIVERYARAIL